MQPQWYTKMLEVYESGVSHAFILHFNVSDYASPDQTMPVVDYLARKLAGTRDVIAIYSRDRGIEFLNDGMRQIALDILGLSETQSDPALDALRAIGQAPAAPAELPSDPASALPLLDKLLRTDQAKTAVIVDGVELVLPPADMATMTPSDRVALATVRRWGRDAQVVNAGNPVYLVTGNIANLHEEIKAASSRFDAIQVPLPSTETRTAFIERWISERGQGIDLNGLTIQAIANATAGLSLMHIEDILLRADARGKLTNGIIWDRKQDIIRSEFGDVLEVIQPRFTFEDIGGLQHVKDFFSRSVIHPIRDGRKSRVPMGVLLTGPAGTGKSIMAEAIATEAQVNAVKLRVGGQIASKWQGQGERNLEKALTAIAGLAPTIVFIDEIDQAVSRGNGESGSQQDQRIFQRLLEFMSDTSHRGEVVFLAATNRPDLMDAALRRPGRFDKKIPFLAPDGEERKNIIAVMTRRYLAETVEAPKKLIEATNGWTGAEIEAAAVKAVELMEDYNLPPGEALEKAVGKLSPSTADIELMTMLAIRETNDRDLLPPRYQKMLDNREELETKIEKAKDQAEPARRRAREL